jgi:hypothetical protein
MRINSRKVRQILGRVWTTRRRIFETFCTQEAPRCIVMNATLTTFYLIQKIKQGFSYTIFLVKKDICWIFLKIMRKLLFNYSVYSHPEIENFRVWQFNLSNGHYLTSVTKNSCNRCLRRPLLEVHIGNGHCGGQPRGRPATLICNGRQITTVTDMGACNGC